MVAAAFLFRASIRTFLECLPTELIFFPFIYANVILFNMELTPSPPRRIERPRSVAILAGIQFLQSLTLLSYGIFWISMAGWPSSQWEFSLDFFVSMLVQVVTSGVGLLVLGLLTGAVSFQLLRMTRYAWLMAMLLQGVILFTSLVAYIRQQPNYLLMASGVILVFYLNQNEIQAVMRGKLDEI
jgi:hypothetical protein